MIKSTVLLMTIATTILIVASCSKSGNDPAPSNCDNVAKSFSANVNTLIQTFCNQPNCHNNGSVNGPGPLTNYTQVFNARSAIRAAVQSGLMPQNTTLNATQKSTIICWIDSGAPNN